MHGLNALYKTYISEACIVIHNTSIYIGVFTLKPNLYHAFLPIHYFINSHHFRKLNNDLLLIFSQSQKVEIYPKRIVNDDGDEVDDTWKVSISDRQNKYPFVPITEESRVAKLQNAVKIPKNK
jgi:hypothetical protein